MKEIKLSQGKVALVDDADYEWLSQWKWSFAKDHTNRTGYAQRAEGKRPDRKIILMHREIMQTPSGMEVEHADLDGCNNQRYNLRNCTHAQNGMNGSVRKTNTSGFRGVSWNKGNKDWEARITISNKDFHLGCFDSPEDAARAYDQAAIRYFGEFANPNFKEPS